MSFKVSGGPKEKKNLRNESELSGGGVGDGFCLDWFRVSVQTHFFMVHFHFLFYLQWLS